MNIIITIILFSIGIAQWWLFHLLNEALALGFFELYRLVSIEVYAFSLKA